MGKKVYDFYTTTSKQALDIHEEAKRLHAANKATPTATTETSGEKVQGGDPAAPPAAGV